ncbi:class I SAM-dependent methyltransferase [Longimicrobium sp.]|uniref:class I SAM-dependent methyltransferase n=1 Tax=Longimicrobium sp. TaxID=2029185 RepID=UPI003B3A2923
MLYDDQAAGFDERAGVPADAVQAVAAALVEMVGPVDGQRWLEVGAGTGGLSLPLLRLPIHYTGFDQSPAMLEVFRQRADAAGLAAALHVADGNARWTAEDASTDVVFSARALHHLDPEHAATETRRVLRAPGGWLVLGRVRRPPDSPKSILRRQMRRMLQAQGFAGRSHEARAGAVFAALERAGGLRMEPRVAARWTGAHRPAESLASWEGKSGLAGIDVPVEAKARVLAELRDWAAGEYGDLDQPLDQEESFELDAIRVPAV